MSDSSNTRLLNIPNEIHERDTIEAFSLTVMLIPGRKPIVVCTPRFTRKFDDGVISKEESLEHLLEIAITKGSVDLLQGCYDLLGIEGAKNVR